MAWCVSRSASRTSPTSSPSSSTRSISLALLVLAALALAVTAALCYMIAMPGRSYRGALEFTAEEHELAKGLRAHVEALAAAPRNTDLERPARYIARELGAVSEQEFASGGPPGRNIEGGGGRLGGGAQFGSVPGSPGAGGKASGVGGGGGGSPPWGAPPGLGFSEQGEGL